MLKYFIFYKIASQIHNSKGCYLFTGIRRESFILFFNFYITLNGNSLFEYKKFKCFELYKINRHAFLHI